MWANYISRVRRPVHCQLAATYVFYILRWLFAPDFWKSFSLVFSQSGCVGIGRPVQYAFTCLSSSSVRPHPDLLHGQPFLLGLKYFSNCFPTNSNPCQPIGLNICFNYFTIIFTHPDSWLSAGQAFLLRIYPSWPWAHHPFNLSFKTSSSKKLLVMCSLHLMRTPSLLVPKYKIF